MKAYIRSAVSISPQKTFAAAPFLNEVAAYHTTRLSCIEPDYNEAIGAKLIRRMSRIIKMSVASALACLKDAGLSQPGAIITGTAYGCLEDTGTFLTSMVEFGEEPISPVAFVQSTHNTIGAQIALLLKCSCYNNTFVSGGASFENAVIDGMMLLNEGYSNVLVGGMDEITDMSYAILSRSGLYKRSPLSNLDLFKTNSKGTIAGEGAAFFTLANAASQNDLAGVDAVSTFYKPKDIAETVAHIKSFLTAQAISGSDINLLITGKNGDEKGDEIYEYLQQSLFEAAPAITYKNLCGEYPTSSAFALWMGANIISNNNIPALFGLKSNPENKINKVLIYNHYNNIHHSLILISSC